MRKVGEVLKMWDDMSPHEQKRYTKKKNTILGDEIEALAFSNFARLLSNWQYKKAKIFSLNGIEYMFPNCDMTAEKTGEFDQIIVVDSIKTVVYVEYKRTFSASHAKRKRQFEHFREFFETNFPSGEGWELVTSYGFKKWPEGGNLRPCKECEQFVFLVEDLNSMKCWFDTLLSRNDVEETICNVNTLQNADRKVAPCMASIDFKDIVSSFLFFALLSKKTKKMGQCMKVAEASKALMDAITDIKGTTENVLFWTNYQHNLLSGNFKHLKLGFKYGTGQILSSQNIF